MKLTDPEKRLLRELQRDCSRSAAELAQAVGMGASTAWRKLTDLTNAGIIRSRVALLDPQKAGLNLCVFAHVTLVDHAEDTIARFAAIVTANPQIMEAHTLSGVADYMLKIRCESVESYEALLSNTLLRAPQVRSVTSAFSLRQLKDSTELPL